MKSTRLFRSALVLALTLGFLGAAGTVFADWWDDQWTGRTRVVVDTGEAGILGEIGSPPVLLRLHGGNFPFEAAARDGSDLRFVAEDGETVLPSHIEKFDSLLHEAFVWVRPLELAEDGKTTFWLYFGKPGSAERGQASSETYDAETTLVYHFGERTSAPRDATSHGNHASTTGILVEGSLVGGGMRLTGRNPVTIPASDSLTWEEASPITWSVWINPAHADGETVLFSRGDDGAKFVIGLTDGAPFVEIVRGGSRSRTAGEAAALQAGSWTHLAVVADGQRVTTFVNGTPGPVLEGAIPALSGAMTIGGDGTLPGFSGEIDELMISRTARSESYLRFLAVNQGTTAAAARLVYLEEGGAGGRGGFFDAGGYFAVIMNSLNADGWIIILLLGVMSVFSWIIMILKTVHFNRIDSANKKFLQLWRQVATDLTMLDNLDNIDSLGGQIDGSELKNLRSAPIYRLYHTGVQEICHRMNTQRRKKLSGSAMQAIRSSMDATFVREGQKLNSRIVYLTLSISGGPFLGLLGTVLGVTITFAAIAAAGEVNINSIAPGVAAALTTTIAGLGVAIPALFGYNYLLSRIKDNMNNMRVFVDEFITKTAEFYSRKDGIPNERGGEGEADGKSSEWSMPDEPAGAAVAVPGEVAKGN